MLRQMLVAIFWILLLSLPLTALSILALGVLTTNGINLFAWLIDWSARISYIGVENSVEIMGRMPEVAGMVAGMLVILITVWVGREPARRKEQIPVHK